MIWLNANIQNKAETSHQLDQQTQHNQRRCYERLPLSQIWQTRWQQNKVKIELQLQLPNIWPKLPISEFKICVVRDLNAVVTFMGTIYTYIYISPYILAIFFIKQSSIEYILML